MKAYKALAKEQPAMRTHATREIALLRNLKTMTEALHTPQKVAWIDAINKEMSSFVDKEVYEVRKLPIGRRLIPTKLVLKIKLASNGSIDKYKERCVVTGYRQTARSPFSILFPTKTPPVHLFKPFGCHATILKSKAALLKKTQPRGLTGIYIGTALPRGQSGYLIWIPSEKRITTAVHPVFDAKNFPACRFSPRIHDLFASLPSTHNELFDDHLSVSHYTVTSTYTGYSCRVTLTFQR